MKEFIRIILAFCLVSTLFSAGFSQVITGNLMATDEELKKLAWYQSSPTAAGEKLPESVDNSRHLVIGHQQEQGACTAFAVSAALSMLASNVEDKSIQFSPHFIWDLASYNNLLEDGLPIPAVEVSACSTWTTDRNVPPIFSSPEIQNYRRRCRDCDCSLCSRAGISIPQALYESRKLGGMPLLEDYKTSDCGKNRPNKNIKRKDIRFISSTVYHAPPRHFNESLPDKIVAEIKSLIAHKLPVVVASDVYFDESYKGEVIDVSSMGVPWTGSHAMTVVGYDMRKIQDFREVPAFKIINSWGSAWGDKGYLWITEEVFKRSVKEVYVVSLESPSDRRTIPIGKPLATMRFELGYKPEVGGKETNVCLDANTYSEGNFDYPNEVIAYTCHDGKNQKWELINIGKPNKYLLKAYNGKFLTLIDDKIGLHVDRNSENAHWLLEKSTDNRRYIFRLSGRETVLGVDSIKIDFYSDKNPVSIELSPRNGSVFQEWKGSFAAPEKKADEN